jgi:Aspartyl protease
MRRAPEVGHDQKKLPSETSSVSRYIKEEDEIDYLAAALGTASQGTSRGPILSTMSIQDQVVSVFEEPLLFTNLSPIDDRFARRSLLGTTVTVGGQDVVALLDSGCEAKLVLSRRFADSNQIQHRPISRVVGLPDGSRIAASRAERISLTIAGSSEEVSAIVVDVDSVGLGDRRGCDECKELLESEQWLAYRTVSIKLGRVRIIY